MQKKLNIPEALKSRSGARHLSDVDIPDETWKADFDIVDRYQTFGNELMRIGLLVIGAFGFLVKEGAKTYHLQNALHNSVFWIGALLLCFSISFVLIHRFFSTSCLFYQVLIMRILKRLDNLHWSQDEKNIERTILATARKKQRIKSRISNVVLILASICFAFGISLIIFACYSCLQETQT